MNQQEKLRQRRLKQEQRLEKRRTDLGIGRKVSKRFFTEFEKKPELELEQEPEQDNDYKPSIIRTRRSKWSRLSRQSPRIRINGIRFISGIVGVGIVMLIASMVLDEVRNAIDVSTSNVSTDGTLISIFNNTPNLGFIFLLTTPILIYVLWHATFRNRGSM